MSLFSIFLIAVGLAMDAFAVAISLGITTPDFKPRHALKVGVYFGAFQLAMPLIGWLLGKSVSGYISAFDHWIAFFLLLIIGGKMAIEGIRNFRNEECERNPDGLKASKLVVLAIATSIDALAMGVGMAILEVNIVKASIIIGVVAFTFSFLGGLLGKKLGCLFKSKAEILGGLILIAIGIKTLVEHLMG